MTRTKSNWLDRIFTTTPRLVAVKVPPTLDRDTEVEAICTTCGNLADPDSCTCIAFNYNPEVLTR